MQSSGMWKCAVGQKVSHVLMDWSLGLLSHAHGHYSPSKHCRLLTQCHSVTPEKTWIFSNIAVRNSNVVCHTSMSVNRSEHWAAAIMYHFNCKISESSDECDSSKSGDCQFEKKKDNIDISTVSSMCSMLQPVLTADWETVYLKFCCAFCISI